MNHVKEKSFSNGAVVNQIEGNLVVHHNEASHGSFIIPCKKGAEVSVVQPLLPSMRIILHSVRTKEPCRTSTFCASKMPRVTTRRQKRVALAKLGLHQQRCSQSSQMAIALARFVSRHEDVQNTEQHSLRYSRIRLRHECSRRYTNRTMEYG